MSVSLQSIWCMKMGVRVVIKMGVRVVVGVAVEMGVRIVAGMVAEVGVDIVVKVVVRMVRLSWIMKRVWFCLWQGDAQLLWRV